MPGSRGIGSDERTVAQLFCLIGGAVLLIRGLVGFAFLDASFATPGEGWHHLIHLVSGGALLVAAWAARPARITALGFGIAYGGIALIGIVDGHDVFGLIGADAADKIFHTVIGLLSLGAGLASPAQPRPQPA